MHTTLVKDNGGLLIVITDPATYQTSMTEVTKQGELKTTQVSDELVDIWEYHTNLRKVGRFLPNQSSNLERQGFPFLEAHLSAIAADRTGNHLELIEGQLFPVIVLETHPWLPKLGVSYSMKAAEALVKSKAPDVYLSGRESYAVYPLVSALTTEGRTQFYRTLAPYGEGINSLNLCEYLNYLAQRKKGKNKMTALFSDKVVEEFRGQTQKIELVEYYAQTKDAHDADQLDYDAGKALALTKHSYMFPASRFQPEVIVKFERQRLGIPQVMAEKDFFTNSKY